MYEIGFHKLRSVDAWLEFYQCTHIESTWKLNGIKIFCNIVKFKYYVLNTFIRFEEPLIKNMNNNTCISWVKYVRPTKLLHKEKSRKFLISSYLDWRRVSDQPKKIILTLKIHQTSLVILSTFNKVFLSLKQVVLVMTRSKHGFKWSSI